MKKLTIVLRRNKMGLWLTEIKGWKSLDLKELMQASEDLTSFTFERIGEELKPESINTKIEKCLRAVPLKTCISCGKEGKYDFVKTDSGLMCEDCRLKGW